MRPEDVYELTGVADARISPDGSRVAYQVWSIDQESNEYRGADLGRAPRRLRRAASASPRARSATRSPRWSPDGRWLAFVSNRGPDKTPANLYVIPAEGGEARKLTDRKEGVEKIAWSPDSTRIAFASRCRDDGVRGGGRPQAGAAPPHASLLQARQRRLDDRPPQAHLRRRPRRRRADAGHGRRLRGRRPRLDAGRQAHPLHGAPRRPLGRRPHQSPLRRRRRRRRAEAAHGRRRVLREPGLLARRVARRVRLRPRGRHLPAPRTDRRHEPGRERRPPADDLARPAVHAVPGGSRAGLGRRPDRVLARGRRQRPRLLGAGGRIVRARAAPRRRARHLQLGRARRTASRTSRRRTRRCASSTSHEAGRQSPT